MENINKNNTYTTYHAEFYRIARENNFEVLNLLKKIHELKNEFRLMSKKNSNKKSWKLFEEIMEISQTATRRSTEVIIFCALTLEAFINYYGIKSFSKNYFTKYLDNLTTIQKWIIIPKLKKNKSIDTGKRPFELLGELFKRRNTLVHYKPKTYEPIDLSGIEKLTSREKTKFYNELLDTKFYKRAMIDSENAINAVRLIIAELKEIDSELEIDWFNQIEMEPVVQYL